MTEREQRDGEDTQTERVSGQPVDAKAELWHGGEDGDADDSSETNETAEGSERS